MKNWPSLWGYSSDFTRDLLIEEGCNYFREDGTGEGWDALSTYSVEFGTRIMTAIAVAGQRRLYPNRITAVGRALDLTTDEFCRATAVCATWANRVRTWASGGSAIDDESRALVAIKHSERWEYSYGRGCGCFGRDDLAWPDRETSEANLRCERAPRAETVILYRFWDSLGSLLYVGITNNPDGRWRSHSGDKEWWPDVVTVTIERHGTREGAAAAEVHAIRTELPRHNKAHSVLMSVTS